MPLQLRRVLFGTRDDLIEALNDEREQTREAFENGRTLRSRTLAEGRREGLDFAIALLSDWEVDGPDPKTPPHDDPEAKP